jgi:hypothetical protein
MTAIPILVFCHETCIHELLLACNNTTPEEIPRVRSVPLHVSSAAGAEKGSEVPGYVHTLSVSRFKPGGTITTVSEMGWNKEVGSEGVFATDELTGAVRASLNGNAPTATIPALTSDPNVHNQAVLSYFLGCGLPQDQVAEVHPMAEMEASGAVGDPSPAQPRFVSYFSRLERQIQGVPVIESFAWARVNKNGDVTAEAVYWPPISNSVVQAARDLMAIDADQTRGPALRKLLPAGSSGGRVVIHHSSSASHVAFAAFASYDVQWIDSRSVGKNHRARIRSFDANGTELNAYTSTNANPPRRP